MDCSLWMMSPPVHRFTAVRLCVLNSGFCSWQPCPNQIKGNPYCRLRLLFRGHMWTPALNHSGIPLWPALEIWWLVGKTWTKKAENPERPTSQVCSILPTCLHWHQLPAPEMGILTLLVLSEAWWIMYGSCSDTCFEKHPSLRSMRNESYGHMNNTSGLVDSYSSQAWDGGACIGWPWKWVKITWM